MPFDYIVYEVGGTLSINHTSRPLTAPTITIETDRGTDIVTAQDCTLSSINTTLSSVCNAGDSSISLTANTGVVSGEYILLSDPDEVVKVKSISGTTAQLFWEPHHSHASGASAVGTKISYTVSNTDATPYFYGGRAVWTIGDEKIVTMVDCTKWPLVNMARDEDVYNEDPTLGRLLDTPDDIPAGLDVAYQDVLAAISGLGRVHCCTSSSEFRRVTALKYLMNFYRRGGERFSDQYEWYKEAYQELLGLIVSAVPRDEDQDEIAEATEQLNIMNIPLYRS